MWESYSVCPRVEWDGQKIAFPHIIRAADKMPSRLIHQEMRTMQSPSEDAQNSERGQFIDRFLA